MDRADLALGEPIAWRRLADASESSETMTSVRPTKRLIVSTGKIMLCIRVAPPGRSCSARFGASRRSLSCGRWRRGEARGAAAADAMARGRGRWRPSS